MFMRVFMTVMLILIFSFFFIITFNPFGVSQRLIWGMQPPYHWVSKPTFPDSLDEEYVGANGVSCANLYKYGTSADYKVYGYGFSEAYVERKSAEELAEKECQ
jgi:hypothetical protein